MLKARTLKVFAGIVLVYVLLWLPAAFAPSYVDAMFLLLIAPLLAAYLLHKVGVPGLLEHDGYCGWGWCSPTWFGWLFTAVVVFLGVWLLAWGIASLTSRFGIMTSPPATPGATP